MAGMQSFTGRRKRALNVHRAVKNRIHTREVRSLSRIVMWKELAKRLR